MKVVQVPDLRRDLSSVRECVKRGITSTNSAREHVQASNQLIDCFPQSPSQLKSPGNLNPNFSSNKKAFKFYNFKFGCIYLDILNAESHLHKRYEMKEEYHNDFNGRLERDWLNFKFSMANLVLCT